MQCKQHLSQMLFGRKAFMYALTDREVRLKQSFNTGQCQTIIKIPIISGYETADRETLA
jgi:hypothetical protein